MAACPVIPFPRSLYEIEETLNALLECVETVTPEQEGAFLEDLNNALLNARDKRDNVAHFLAHMQSQITLAKDETARLRQRKAQFERTLARLEEYVVRVVDASGRKTLEGSTVTFSTAKCPASVLISDEAAVPLAYKLVLISIPGSLLDQVLDALPLESPARVEYTVDKISIKCALESKIEVPGAKLVTDKRRLVIK